MSQNPSMPRGLTMVEIILLAAILCLILSLLIPNYQDWRRARLGTECNGRLEQIYSALEQYTFRNNAGDLAPWPAGDPEATVNAYLQGLGFSVHDGCPAGGVYHLGSTMTDASGNIIVPTCSLETQDPKDNGILFRYQSLHIHSRSFINGVRNPNLTFAT